MTSKANPVDEEYNIRNIVFRNMNFQRETLRYTLLTNSNRLSLTQVPLLLHVMLSSVLKSYIPTEPGHLKDHTNTKRNGYYISNALEQIENPIILEVDVSAIGAESERSEDFTHAKPIALDFSTKPEHPDESTKSEPVEDIPNAAESPEGYDSTEKGHLNQDFDFLGDHFRDVLQNLNGERADDIPSINSGMLSSLSLVYLCQLSYTVTPRMSATSTPRDQNATLQSPLGRGDITETS
ncbi:hypothetical protein MMC07_008987 [Pseudocyphellaria aurata]|nr:hypothetical protein [Pseudocyphellaria aurata]